MHADTCSITGLTMPECSCEECIRQLLARFGPAEVQAALTAATDAYEAEVEAAIGAAGGAAPSEAAERPAMADQALAATDSSGFTGTDQALAAADSPRLTAAAEPRDALSVAERLTRPAL